MALRGHTGSTRTAWPTALSGVHLNDTYFTEDGCRRAAAALARERLGAESSSPRWSRSHTPRSKEASGRAATSRAEGAAAIERHASLRVPHPLGAGARDAEGAGRLLRTGRRLWRRLVQRPLQPRARGQHDAGESAPFHRRTELRYQLSRLDRGLRGAAYELGQRLGVVTRRLCR